MLDLYKYKSLFLIFCFVFVFGIANVSAEDETFQFNKEFDLKRACFDNGNFCGSGFVCNITLIYPDGTLLVNNLRMTDQTSFRNITISQTLNNQLGVVNAIESCNNVSNAGADTFPIFITADGKPPQQFPFQFSITILALLFVGVGLSSDRFRLFQTSGAMLMIVMGVITLYPGYSFINYSNLPGLGLGTILIGLGFYFMISHSFSRDDQQEGFEQKPEEVDQ